jgi:hypothetical protein
LANGPVEHIMTCTNANQAASINRHDHLNKTLQQIADSSASRPLASAFKPTEKTI